MNKEDTEIVITDENLDILQKMSSDFHRLYADAMKEFAEKELKLIDDILDFGYRITQVIGIVAGFGFTAIGFVKNLGFFAIGEACLFGSIIFGIYKIKRIYTSNLEAIQESSKNKKEVFQEGSKFYQEYINKAVKERKFNGTEFQSNLEIIDEKLLAEFSGAEKSESKEGDFLNVIILLLLTGAVSLLLSFFSIKI